jgi:hypothetical protein
MATMVGKVIEEDRGCHPNIHLHHVHLAVQGRRFAAAGDPAAWG